MAPAIPERWLDYTPIGRQIEGTRFIAFKVPLKQHLNKSMLRHQRLDINTLFERIPKLGIIIDLTNTNRYYNPHHICKDGIDYKKICTPGHITPSYCLVKEFRDCVKAFLFKNSANDKLIGVHCTHGVNRTGYFICSYMISELAIEPAEAIQRFVAARGHEIERSNYLNALNRLKQSNLTRKIIYTGNNQNKLNTVCNFKCTRGNGHYRKSNYYSSNNTSKGGFYNHNFYSQNKHSLPILRNDDNRCRLRADYYGDNSHAEF
ncbi:RNA/RNP complex-1-interacting phosphatase isoform X2 [Glossina fuscipes]|nr:RNA/RNP complex-1-interacting phosphatase isoform X2 [Glossina fuscipes]XP_037898421.1 RNA/RNP complex-1-interacting phosphatase isoform X2 [Glossina fuscipes]XP_037898422.1 RNA/RNP complex-1-interacting phosphatase isoform X2 [Glossina fuscipes]KAI9575786.1 hypothetical protein GQX74_014640 [Glossina fuscipes]